MRLDTDISVGWFSVYSGGKSAIIVSCHKNIKEGDGIVFFLLARELDPRVNRVEAFIEVLNGISLRFTLNGATKARATRGTHHGAPTVIHVNENIPWDGVLTLTRNLDGSIHGMHHPYLANGHH